MSPAPSPAPAPPPPAPPPPPAGGHVPGSHLAGLGAPRHHIVTAMVENKAGVLARVASLFSRRGFNIFSLAVAPTDDERFSRITIVVDVESAPLEQIMKQLDKLINVVTITELAPHEAVEREMLLVTVSVSVAAGGGGVADAGGGVADAGGAGGAAGASGASGGGGGRGSLADLVESFDAAIVDQGADRVTVMLAGTPGRIDEFEELVRPFGITELQRTGLVALPKLSPVPAETPT